MRAWFGLLAVTALAGCAPPPAKAWTHGAVTPVTACPWSSADGCLVAPALAMPVQLSSFFPASGATTGGLAQQSGQVYTQGRPPFAIPAVDYAVGIYTPLASHTDVYAASVAHTLPAGCSLSGFTLTCSGSGAFNLSGYRFDNPSGAGGYDGYQLSVNCTSMTSALLDNDYFIAAASFAGTTGGNSYMVLITGTCNNLTNYKMSSSTLYGNAANLHAAGELGHLVSMVRENHTGTNDTIYDYNDVSQMQQKSIQIAGTGNVTLTHNVLRDAEYASDFTGGYHGDGFWFGSQQPGVASITAEYNMCWQGSTEVDTPINGASMASCFVLTNLLGDPAGVYPNGYMNNGHPYASGVPWNVRGVIKFDHNVGVTNAVALATSNIAHGSGTVQGDDGSLAWIGYSPENSGVINEIDLNDNWTDPSGSPGCFALGQSTNIIWGTGTHANHNLLSPILIADTTGASCALHH